MASRRRDADELLDYESLELDAKLAKYEALASEEQREGGLPKVSAAIMTVLGLIGMWASLSLIVSEKIKLSDPNASLACDINPLVGCGKWIGTWQNEVFFGISNSVLGLAFFAGITALGLALFSGGRFGSWLWKLLSLGMIGAIVWVLWFQFQSFVVEGSLCPYCVVTWLTTIPLAYLVWSRSLQAGHWGAGAEKLGSMLVRERFMVVGAIYLVLVIFTIIWFWDKWALVF